jgi:hypothetical protein
MKINNYELNNTSIGILDFIQKYKTNYTVFEGEEDKNNIIYNNIRNGTYSPIKKNFNEVSFDNIYNLKKSFNNEVFNLIKKNILIQKNNLFCVNMDFYEEVFLTNFNEVLPKPKKNNQDIIDFLIHLCCLKENGKDKIRFNEVEIVGFQSIFKNTILPSGFIDYKNYKEEKIAINIIYKADRNPEKDVGKEKLTNFISINQNGINYLENNDLYHRNEKHT